MENENQYYIVRTDRAGVFFGQIKSKTETSVIMTNVRKIYYWDGACGVEQIATDGVDDSSKLTVVISEMEIDRWIQVIPCTDKAIQNLQSKTAWKK